MSEIDPDDVAREAAAPRPPTMGVEIANAIVVNAPLTKAQVECALEHYAQLEAMLRVSGPRFANHRRDAAEYHNKALARLREIELAEDQRAGDDGRRRLEA